MPRRLSKCHSGISKVLWKNRGSRVCVKIAFKTLLKTIFDRLLLEVVRVVKYAQLLLRQ